MSRLAFLFTLGTAILAGACAQRDEIIAIAADDEEGGGGAGGGVVTGGGPPTPLTPIALETPSCEGTLDEMAVGSLDGGEGSDLVVGGDGCVTLYSAQGDTLASPVELADGGGRGLALGRLETTTPSSDADALDLVRIGDELVVLLGDGLGGFTPGQVLPVASPVEPGGVVLASVGGNGALDLVYGDVGHVIVRYGNGDGTFGDEHPFPVASGARQLVVADLDDDGEADVVTAGAGAAVLLGDGLGGFHTAQPLDGGDHIGVVALGDLNGDGCADAAGVEGRPFQPGTGDARLHLWLGDCEGHLFEEAALATPAPTGVTLGDFDRDGHVDAAVTVADGLLLLSFDGHAGLLAEHVIPLDGSPRRPTTIDLGADERPEVVVTAGDRLYLLHAP